MLTLDFTRITSNLFFLSTLIFAAVGWIIAFAGACASATGLASHTWFVILFNLFLLVGIFVALCAPGGLPCYRLTIMSFSAANIVFVSNKIAEHVDTFPKAANAAGRQTLAAGLIFVNITYFLWIFAFGAEEGSAVYRWTQRLGVTGTHPHRDEKVELGGMKHAHANAIPLASSENMIVTVSPNAQYPYKAEAIYAYTSNPEDPNEISFQQGEILDIADCKGKWWQARKSDGVVGIAPSNYLKLLN